MPLLALTSTAVLAVAGSVGCCGLGALARRLGGSIVFQKIQLWGHPLSLEEFQEVISFLGSLPLFRKQLPKAELPKVAKALRVQQWAPGEKVIEQGELGKSFFIIKSGEALMVATSGKDTIENTLYRGDYFGIDALVTKQTNPATIIAKGPEKLVVLGMSRETFESLGLARIGKARRRALGKGSALLSFKTDDLYGALSGLPKEPVTAQEELFVEQSLVKNSNLRALVKVDSDAFHKIAKYAEKRIVRKGQELGHNNQFQSELVVVESGALDVIPNIHTQALGARSPEGVLSSRLVAERLVRKQQFLLNLTTPPSDNRHAQSQSMFSATPSMPRIPHRSFTMDVEPGIKEDNLYSSRSFQDGGGEAPTSEFEVGLRVRRINLRLGSGEGGELGTVVGIVPASGTPRNVSPTISPYTSPLTPFPQASRSSTGKALVTVNFSTCGTVSLSADELRPVEEMKPIHTLRRGEVFGELSLLYNARQVATCRAVEDSVVYTMRRQHFKECFLREDPNFQKHCKLLAEVAVLSPLLKAEREEVVRNATGLMHFQPQAQILFANVVRKAQLWYIVDSGSVLVWQANGVELATLSRGCHFGERSILKGEKVSDISVRAGDHGCSCLVFDGSLLQSLPLNLGHADSPNEAFCEGVQSVSVDVSTYVHSVAKTAAKSILFADLNPCRLETVAPIGHGSFGNVYLVAMKQLPNGNGRLLPQKKAVMLDSREELPRHFALKRMSKGYIEDYCLSLDMPDVKKQLCSERNSLSVVDSPFITYLYKSWQDNQFLYLVMELATGGDLGDLMDPDRIHVLIDDRPRGSNVMFYVGCITMGLEHIHERRIAHRDLKLENVMIGQNGYAKLCDFGFSRFMLGKTYTMCGTPDYMAPEIIDKIGYGTAVDWWALGVVTFELLTGNTPWDNVPSDLDNGFLMCQAIRDAQDHADFRLPSSLKLAQDFVTKLLCMQDHKRLGATPCEVRQHPWFRMAQFDFDRLENQILKAPYVPATTELQQTYEWSPAKSLDFRDPSDAMFVPKSYPPDKNPRDFEDWENWPVLDGCDGHAAFQDSKIIY